MDSERSDGKCIGVFTTCAFFFFFFDVVVPRPGTIFLSEISFRFSSVVLSLKKHIGPEEVSIVVVDAL